MMWVRIRDTDGNSCSAGSCDFASSHVHVLGNAIKRFLLFDHYKNKKRTTFSIFSKVMDLHQHQIEP